MIAIKCLDSSAWLAYYLNENSELKMIIDHSSLIVTSSLSLFEIKKRLLSLKKETKPLLEFIKSRSEIVLPKISITEKAAELAIEKKLGAMDALIYTTSLLHQAELITGDNDFRGLEKVTIIS